MENHKFKFEKLIIWQKAMDLGEELVTICKPFPNHEKFNLSSQLSRAIDSVALNISEGSILQSDLEQKRFLGYAIRSLAEVITCLHKAKRRTYITEDIFNEHYDESFNLMNTMVAFRKKVN